MPTILDESLITIHEAAALLPNNRAGGRVNFSTVWRWIMRGIATAEGHRHKLEAIRLGGRWLTSREALQRFAERLTPTEAATVRTPAGRAKAARRATKRLETVGI